MRTFWYHLIAVLSSPPPRDERGLSQSTENAILLAGAVTIAVGVVTAITFYVQAKLPQP
jgi:hypothetical protein